MTKHIKNLFENPLSFSLVLFLLAIGFIYVSALGLFVEIVSSVLAGLGSSFIVAAAFAIIYEYFSKENIISSAVDQAVGQSRASALGVRDITEDVGTIDHKPIFRNSEVLRISSRYSGVLLHGQRTEVYKRLKNDKREISFLRMADAGNVPKGRGPEGTPDKFFQTLSPGDGEVLKRVKLYKSIELFSYNFVEADSGIWIKLYLNAEKPVAPPAFFVEKGSRLYDIYKADIDSLFENAVLVELNDEPE